MALDIPNGGADYLLRTSGIVQGSSAYTCTFWARLTNAIGGGEYRTYLLQLDSRAVYKQWAGMFSNFGIDDAELEASAGAGATTTPGYLLGAEWRRMAYVRNGTTHTFFAEGAVIGSFTKDVSATTFGEQVLGNDAGSTGA